MDLGFGSVDLLNPLVAYINVTEYYIHPRYDSKLKHHDVALIKLPSPITENGERIRFCFVLHFLSQNLILESIRIIALPNSTDDVTYNFAMGIVAGFGRYLENSNVISRFLRWTMLKIIPNEVCKQIYGDKVIISSTLCAVSVRNSSRNTCNGDSGGSIALVEGRRIVLAGIISFAATDRCGGQYPSGFMRIRSHLHWMRNEMNKY